MILFICIGNTARSPMAEYIAKEYAKEHGLPYTFSSAGLYGCYGDVMNENSLITLEKRGIQGKTFSSRRVNDYLLDDSRLLVPLTKNIAEDLLIQYPNVKDKIYCFWDHGGTEIYDPWQGTLEDYEKAAKMIEENLEILWKDLEEIL
ncbi:MAG: hypothetical protein Q4Q07_06710 [Tissierellia bacterium]|nr:hypothetical protein [Tissierellia bacterium]